MLPRDYFASNRSLVEERGPRQHFRHQRRAAQIARVARDVIGRDGLAAISSFGTESAALLKLVSDVDPAIPVLLVDTGWLLPETLAHRDAVVAKLGLIDVRSITPDPNKLEQRDPNRTFGLPIPMPAAQYARSSRSPTHWCHSRPG